VALILPTAAAWTEVKVFFSPQGGCDRALVELAQASRMYLYAACYTFSVDWVADELIAAERRGPVRAARLAAICYGRRERLPLHGGSGRTGLHPVHCACDASRNRRGDGSAARRR